MVPVAVIGWAHLGVVPSFSGFEDALNRETSKHMAAAGTRGGASFGEAAGRSGGKRFGSVFKTAAKASLVGLAGVAAGAIKVGMDSIDLASDLGESINAVNVSYDKQARAVRKLGTQAADSLGLSNEQFNSLAVRFSAFSKTIAGGQGKKVVTTLDDLTTRAADFASVMNLDVNEAANLFQSGLAGETEPLRRYGLDLSAAAVEAHAFATGIATGSGELTEAEKIQARYSLLMQQTTKTAGDFANTSDSLANRQRILNARWDDARAKLGTGLLPYMEDASGWILNTGLPAFERFSDWFNSKGLPAIQDFADDMRPLARNLLPATAEALGSVRDMLRPAAKYAADLVGAFNDMPDWAKTAIVGGGASLLVGSKLGLGKAAGGALGALKSAKPIPVFVVNEGFGGDGVAGGKKGWLKSLAGWGGPLAAAAAVAGGATLGINKLQESVAPKAYDKGISGSPNFGTGLAAGGFLQDIGKDADAAKKKIDGAKKSTVDFTELFRGPHRLTIDDTELTRAIETTKEYRRALAEVSRVQEGVLSALGMGGPTVNIGRVEAHNYDDFMQQAQNRSRRAASDGIRLPATSGGRRVQ